MEDYTYRFIQDSDIPQIKKIIKEYFSSFLEGNYWEWKYRQNQSFSPSLIFVAEKNGEVVGCTHVLEQKLKIARNLVANVALGSDLVIRNEYRKKSIGKSLVIFSRVETAKKNKDVTLVRAFTNEAISKRFHKPILGYISVKSSTKTYTRLLNWNRILAGVNQNTIETGNKEKTVTDVPVIVSIKLRGAPHLNIKVYNKNVEFSEKAEEKFDIKVEGNFSFIMSLGSVKHLKWSILKALVTRKIKIHVKVSSLLKLYRVFQAIENILSHYKLQ